MKVVKFILFLIFALAVIKVSSVSGQDRPQGLEDKGPLTKRTFIHYKKINGNAKPPSAGGGQSEKCYGFLASGAKWKTTENYLINPGGSGISDNNTILNAFNNGVGQWESYGGYYIFGSAAINASAAVNQDSTDDLNVVVFGNYPDPDVIAVTQVWGYFYGPPQTRELVEWDMVFNTGTFAFGVNSDPDVRVMDLENIATHELGHSAGMGDIYSSSCTLETEYGYSGFGEINKRSLHSGDIAGISKLY